MTDDPSKDNDVYLEHFRPEKFKGDKESIWETGSYYLQNFYNKGKRTLTPIMLREYEKLLQEATKYNNKKQN